MNGRQIDFPEDCYQGDYIKDLAKKVAAEQGADFPNTPEDEGIAICARYAAGQILDGIKQDLNGFGVSFDNWFSEQSLYDEGRVQNAIEEYKKRDLIFEEDGALWFRTETYGDEKTGWWSE